MSEDILKKYRDMPIVFAGDDCVDKSCTGKLKETSVGIGTILRCSVCNRTLEEIYAESKQDTPDETIESHPELEDAIRGRDTPDTECDCGFRVGGDSCIKKIEYMTRPLNVDLRSLRLNDYILRYGKCDPDKCPTWQTYTGQTQVFEEITARLYILEQTIKEMHENIFSPPVGIPECTLPAAMKVMGILGASLHHLASHEAFCGPATIIDITNCDKEEDGNEKM